MKHIIVASILTTAASLSAQTLTFVAGWDFDGVAANATSATANWGAQMGSAAASWTHAPANPPMVFDAKFGISPANNSAAINNSFTFLTAGSDSTGFNAFSDNEGGAEQGFQSLTDDDTFTLNFDGTGWRNLSLSYATAPTQSGTFTVTTVDLSAFDGVALARLDLTPAANQVYDNFAIIGVLVPEPSTYAAILGVIALAVAATRRRK